MLWTGLLGCCRGPKFCYIPLKGLDFCFSDQVSMTGLNFQLCFLDGRLNQSSPLLFLAGCFEFTSCVAPCIANTLANFIHGILALLLLPFLFWDSFYFSVTIVGMNCVLSFFRSERLRIFYQSFSCPAWCLLWIFLKLLL